MDPIIFHIDVNSAFLSWSSVEKLKLDKDAVDLRTIPAIIGGDKANRHGIVLAKSVPAKAYNIQTGEPIVQALRKCPFLTIEPPCHDVYSKYSKNMMDLLRSYTPDIQQLSIDECFMDFTPIQRSYASPLEAATIIKEDIKNRFGFTVNIGIAPNKLLAKMASDFTKPDRIHTLFKDEIPTKMWPLPVSELYMVGKSSANRLESFGIHTIGDLANTDLNFLLLHFKSHGKLMWEYANGIDSSVVSSAAREVKGVGNSVTLSEDATSAEVAKRVLLSLSETVSSRLRKKHQLAQNLTVEIKYSNFTSFSHQMPLFTPSNTTNSLYDISCTLFDELWNQEPIRLLGIRANKLLADSSPIQMSIFDFGNDAMESSSAKVCSSNTNLSNQASKKTNYSETNSDTLSSNRLRQMDAAIDTIRNKFGDDSIVRGTFLKSKNEFKPKKKN